MTVKDGPIRARGAEPRPPKGDDSRARRTEACARRRIELLQSGMQVGEISSAYLPGTQEDTVLMQDPPPGTTDVTSPHVNFLVSLGSRPRGLRDAGPCRASAERSAFRN